MCLCFYQSSSPCWMEFCRTFLYIVLVIIIDADNWVRNISKSIYENYNYYIKKIIIIINKINSIRFLFSVFAIFFNHLAIMWYFLLIKSYYHQEQWIYTVFIFKTCLAREKKEYMLNCSIFNTDYFIYKILFWKKKKILC